MSIDKRGPDGQKPDERGQGAAEEPEKSEDIIVHHEGARRAGEGIIVSIQPDYCRVGETIVPFIIHAYLSDAINTAKTVNMTGKPVVHKGTIIPCCYGAEASDGGGVVSRTVNGACWPLTWSKTVYVEGEPVVRDGDLWAMNNGNTIGRLMFPTPALPPDEPENEADEVSDKARYVDTPPPDGLPQPQDSQYDFVIEEPLKEGADYARSVAAPARPAPRRAAPATMPIAPRRMLRSPDPNRDPDGYRRYWDSVPARANSGLFYRPYPRRYWPNVLGNSVETSFHNPYLGRPQATGMARPWSNVVAHSNGQFDFGDGRVINEDEFSQLYFLHHFGSREEWARYNQKLHSAIQQRNPDFKIPFILSDNTEIEGTNGAWANKPLRQRQLPLTTQAIAQSLNRDGDDNVRVTGRHLHCKILPLCFAPEVEALPTQQPQLGEFSREYRRQLALQEQYMNRMKPPEVLANMAFYDLMGGERLRSAASSGQNKVRKDYKEILTNRYKSTSEIDNTEARVDAEMRKLAVLHNPDMVAGGRIFSIADPTIPIEDKIGWASVNSSIGAQWPSRRNLLRQHLIEQSLNNCPSPQVKLRNCRSVKGQPGVPMQEQP